MPPPIAQVPVAAAPPAAPPAAAPAAAPAVDPAADPVWIKARLEREAVQARNRTLAELGITDVTAAKAAIASATAASEATKSAEQRALEASGRVTSLSAENERLASITREHAARMMAVLTPAQQAAVRASFPDADPAGQLQAIGNFGPTWASAQAAIDAANATAVAAEAARVAALTPPPAAAPAAAPPATTAPGATAPAGGPTESPPDHKSVYAATRSKNPFAAAAYGLANPTEVYRPKA